MNISQTVSVFKALMQEPASRLDLADKTGATPKFVGKVLAELKTQKMIYVLQYSNETDGRNRVKIYTTGDGEDALPKSSQVQRIRSRKNYLKKTGAKTYKPASTFVGGKSPWA